MGDGFCIHLLDAGRCPHCHGLAPALKQRSARIAQRMAEARDRAAWLAGYEAARAQAVGVATEQRGRFVEARARATSWSDSDYRLGQVDCCEVLAEAIAEMEPKEGE